MSFRPLMFHSLGILVCLLRGWFKGADTVCILDFLESWIGNHLDTMDEPSKAYFLDIYGTIQASNAFMRCIYGAALWLSDAERNMLLKMGSKLINSFHRCAKHAYNSEVTRWKYMPKFHSFGEILFSLERQKRKAQPSLNPLTFCTQQDEDFIGRVSIASRHVSVRTVHSRTLTRYLVALVSKW